MLNPNINPNIITNNSISLNSVTIKEFVESEPENIYDNYEDTLALCTIYSKMGKSVNYYYTSGTKTGWYS